MGDISTAGGGRRRWPYLLPVILLLSTIPWCQSAGTVFGLPVWAVVSLALSTAYAVVVAFGLRRVFGGLPPLGPGDGGEGGAP